MLSIQRLRMRLPQGYAHRAGSISRHLGAVLAEAGHVADHDIAHLSLDPVSIHPHSSDRQIAESIARQILASIRSL